MPLGPDCVNQFVADTIRCSAEQSQPLAEILYLKTGGNPCLLGQILQAAYSLVPIEQKKVAHLQMAQLLMQNTIQEAPEEEIINVGDTRDTGDPVLYTIQKAVQKLAEETDAEALLEGFLGMAIEHAGADKGYLMLEKAGKMLIEAVKERDMHTVSMITPLSLEKNVNLSRAMVRYVIRTLEPVVLNDMEQAGIFARDPYIAQSRAKAIVCLPLLFRNIPVGILYLENSLMTGVFTPDRLEVLKILAFQLAYIRKMHTCLAENTTGAKDETPLPLIEPFTERLTERELEVLSLIADGMSNQEIAQELQLTVSTVKTHILNIYGKLRVNRRVQAVTRAKELRLL
jgi:DNA-binding CsgD family transcriptional regulator